MKRADRTARAIILCTSAGLAASAGSARASVLGWINVVGGAASTSGNWSPTQIPTAADTLTFNLNNTYTVTYNNTVAASTAHTYKRGTVTLSLTSPNTVSGNFRVGDVSGDAATATVTTGTLTAGSVTIGNAAGSAGTVNVNDSDADLLTSGAGDIVIGAAGAGTANITAGGVLRSGDDIILGSAGGDGNLSVSGFGTSPLRFSSVQTTASDGDIVVGNSSGTVSTLTVGANGIVNCADDLQVGLVGGASGVVNVSGTVGIGGDLQVGNNSTLTTAGSGTVTALDNGTINVTGAIRLGDTTAGSGTLTCRDGGAVNAHSIICDSNGGFLNLLGGETHVDGGVLTAPNSLLAIDGAAGENPFLRLLSGTTCSLSAPSSPFRALSIGNAHDANLTVEGASSLTVSSGDAILGIQGSSAAQLIFVTNSTGTFPASRKITVGASGTSTFRVASGATVSAGSMELGTGATGRGTLDLNDGDLTLAGTLSVGGTPTVDGGVGDLTLDASSTCTANATGDAVLVYGGGTVNIFPGCTLSAPNGIIRFFVGSSLALDRGTITADELSIGAISPSLHGTVNANTTFAGANVIVNPAGDITINGHSGGSALVNIGTINLGDHTLTINGGSTNSRINNCTLGPSGRIEGTANLQVISGSTLSGDGTVVNSIVNSGTITATGDGLTFGGIVTGVGQGMSGVRFTFASGGGFTGGGSLNAKVVGQQGSKLTFTANSSAGDGTTTGFTTDGEIDITAGNLILSDSNGVGMGSLTTLRNNSTLTCASAINMGTAPTLDVLQGQGFVNSTVNCSGVIRPGIVGGDETGQISVLGSLALNSGTIKGQLQVDLAGTAAADRDRVTATGPITADGTIKVGLINGFTPANGFSAAVLSSTASVTGTFVNEILPPKFHVEYGPKDVFVVFCAADFDNDGFISGDDFDQYLTAFELGDGAADFNNDGFVTGEDFDEFVAAFEAGC